MTGPAAALERGTDRPPAQLYDAALLDLDGVVYVGPTAVPYAAEALAAARSAGMRLAFVTNNASRTPDKVAAHLRELGVLEEGPKEDSLSDQYALLANEDYVLRAIDHAHAGLRGTSEVRRTVQISPLGTELWAACRPDDSEVVAEGTPAMYRSAYAGAPPRPGKLAES